LFDNFKLCFNVAISLVLISDLTKGSTRPGNNSQALSFQSVTLVPIEDEIPFAVKMLDDAALEQQIAGDLLYCNQKRFNYLTSNLRFYVVGRSVTSCER